MKTSQLNKAVGNLSSARLDFNEAAHFFPGSRRRTRFDAKKVASRAARRAGKALAHEAAS